MKKRASKLSPVSAVEIENERTEMVERFGKKYLDINLFIRNQVPVILMAIFKNQEEQENKNGDKPLEELSKARITEIQKETKIKLKLLAAQIAPPFSSILPAPALSDKNASDLCTYVADKFPRINAINTFSTCTPSVATCTDLYLLLLPLAGLSRANLTKNAKTNRDMYTKQLRTNFLLMMQSCATLSVGNLPMFSLTDVATRTNGVTYTKQLDAVAFKLNTKKGKGKVGVSCDKMEHAVNYTIFYGEGEYNPSTWFSKTGGAKQVVEINLKPGIYFNFIMVANGTVLQGQWADKQGCYVPHN